MRGIRKNYLFFGVLLIVIISVGCTGEPQTSSTQPETVSAPATTSEELGTVEKGIITDSLILNDGDEIITRNKLIKTANAKSVIYYNDSEEWGEGFFEEEVTMVPFLVNYICRMYTLLFFNETGFKELQESMNGTTEETEIDVFLEGYTVTKATVIFKDRESDEMIAECSSTGPAWEDIKFKVYRDYPIEKTFFKAEIGVRE